MMNVLFMPTDTKKHIVLQEIHGALEEAQLLLGSKKNERAFIERIRTPIKGLFLYVDEDAIAKRLPLNSRAMLFYAGPIYGPALLTYEEHVVPSPENGLDPKDGPQDVWVGIPEKFDFEIVAQCSYERICATIGVHPFVTLTERPEPVDQRK